ECPYSIDASCLRSSPEAGPTFYCWRTPRAYSGVDGLGTRSVPEAGRLHPLGWCCRAQFFALAAQLMRRILVDFARSRKNQKRGGAGRRASLDEALLISDGPDPQLVELDALTTPL